MSPKEFEDLYLNGQINYAVVVVTEDSNDIGNLTYYPTMIKRLLPESKKNFLPFKM